VPITEIATRIEPYLDLIAADHPHYDKWRREMGPAALDPEQVWEQGFQFGLERLLDGLELWLARRADG
jgi:hypothetical protein